MAGLVKKTSKKYGLKPGSIVHLGERHGEEVYIDVIDYNEAEHHEKQVASIEERFTFRDTHTLTCDLIA